MDWRRGIVLNPEVRGGKPCIKGTRITVYDVLEYLAGGMNEVQILADFPELTQDDVRACLSFAAARERRLRDASVEGDGLQPEFKDAGWERIRGAIYGEPP